MCVDSKWKERRRREDHYGFRNERRRERKKGKKTSQFYIVGKKICEICCELTAVVSDTSMIHMSLVSRCVSVISPQYTTKLL